MPKVTQMRVMSMKCVPVKPNNDDNWILVLEKELRLLPTDYSTLAEIKNPEDSLNIRNRKQNQTKKIQSWFFGKTNKIDRCLVRLSKVLK